MPSRLAAWIGVCILATAGLGRALPAWAGDAVALRVNPTVHGASITLGDLFEGLSAAAAKAVVAKAPRPGADVVLEAGKVQAAAQAVGVDWANTNGMRRIVVRSGRAADPETRVSARRIVQTLAYARNLAAGDIVTASDLVWSEEAVAPGDAPRDAEAVIGQAARRPLRSGDAVAAHDLVAPRVIRRDETVAVAFQADGIRLVLQGKAMADAAVGDILQVENLQSKKMIQTVVTGPGEAAVGPAADALRAAAVVSPYRTALR